MGAVIGKMESTCFSNCGQSPPEITATLMMSRRSCKSIDVLASRADLHRQAYRRDQTISFFILIIANAGLSTTLSSCAAC